MNHNNIAEMIWAALCRVRAQKPLIHCMTNSVAMDFQANSLLSLGTSPIMSIERAELEELIQACSALSLNIGTIESHHVEAALLSIEFANKYSKTLVFDPVGSGATSFRSNISKKIYSQANNLIVKGNASEIYSLNNSYASGKGVDSTLRPEEVLKQASDLINESCQAIVITGKTDYILTDHACWKIENGSELMTKVTAMGCSLGGVIAAFCLPDVSHEEAVISACSIYSLSGQIAAKNAAGPGSFKTFFLDVLCNISREEIFQYLRVDKYEI